MTYRGPKMIGDVVSELMARNGFGRLQSAEAVRTPRGAKPPDRSSRNTAASAGCGGARWKWWWRTPCWFRIGLPEENLLKALSQLLPDQGITNLRFRSGAIE